MYSDLIEPSRPIVVLTSDILSGDISLTRVWVRAYMPFTDAEREFLNLLLGNGVVDATILTADTALQQRIQSQPLLEWKALNVRKHRGLV